MEPLALFQDPEEWKERMNGESPFAAPSQGKRALPSLAHMISIPKMNPTVALQWVAVMKGYYDVRVPSLVHARWLSPS